jgi:methionyl aminopeptidase
MGDISHAVESIARRGRYGLPHGFGGHGIGTAMHEDPHVPNTGRAGRGLTLRDGLVIAIEPMLLEGGRDVGRTLDDGWTVATADGSRAAHAEHTIAITSDGPVILTLP